MSSVAQLLKGSNKSAGIKIVAPTNLTSYQLRRTGWDILKIKGEHPIREVKVALEQVDHSRYPSPVAELAVDIWMRTFAYHYLLLDNVDSLTAHLANFGIETVLISPDKPDDGIVLCLLDANSEFNLYLWLASKHILEAQDLGDPEDSEPLTLLQFHYESMTVPLEPVHFQMKFDRLTLVLPYVLDAIFQTLGEEPPDLTFKLTL